MPGDRDIAEELREVLRLHALHMKSIMDGKAAPVAAPVGVALPAPAARFSKLMRAAM